MYSVTSATCTLDPAGSIEMSTFTPLTQSWTVTVPGPTTSGTSHPVHVPPAGEVGVTVAVSLPLKFNVSVTFV